MPREAGAPSGRGDRGDWGSPDPGARLGLLSVKGGGVPVHSAEGLGAFGGGHIFMTASTAGSGIVWGRLVPEEGWGNHTN